MSRRHETMIDHPKLRVDRWAGEEGPRHDPYSYEELHVTTPKGEVVLHQGLGTWMKVDGKTVDQPTGLSYDDYERWLRTTKFEEATGLTIKQIDRVYRHLKSICPKCGGREFITERGYPGETLEICASCNHVVGGFMDYGAIE